MSTSLAATAAPARSDRLWPRLRALLGGAFTRSIAVLTFLAVWEVLPRSGAVDAVFLPPVSEVATTAWQMALSGTLATHLGASLLRVLAGFLLAVGVCIPAGLAIGASRRLAMLLDPVMEIFRNTAPLALLPVFTLILGIGETSKVAMVFYAASWPLLLSTITGVRTVDPLLIKAARSLGLRPVALFRKVVLPASVPTIFTGIRLASGMSILVLIAAEMVGARAGLGYLVNAAQFNFEIPQMYAGILLLSLLGVTINALLVSIERRLSAWNRV
ncbi:ABC transporter permease [Rhodovastum atsumiense]|uniref:ABC transporter permease n=1 Tax=Rhodovastum atsumiense TaxID=504468 RepID=A0A5M6IZ00_9PROT|nr:ABC transporter permease [Rhodovastum atsumiense]KAA5613523.1 ABC transporter permease [Rhodovastum atsumiense]CAH2603273.1 ABC transporter permease [Rhodovastum atsumiense]